MTYPLLLSLFLGFMLCGAEARAQNKPAARSTVAAHTQVPSMPSEEEINELLSSSSERITEFQRALDNVKPLLDRADPEFYKQDSEACETAQAAIKAMKKNGSSAYALVALVSLLDDLNLDASRATLQIFRLAHDDDKTGKKNPSIVPDFLNIAEAGKNCGDISELLLHATLRYIAAEESALSKLFPNTK
jgi:hypothetical protein